MGGIAIGQADSITRPVRRFIAGQTKAISSATADILSVFVRPESSTEHAALAITQRERVEDIARNLEFRVDQIDRQSMTHDLSLGLCAEAIRLYKDPSQNWQDVERKLQIFAGIFEVMPKGFYLNQGLSDDDVKVLEELQQHFSPPVHEE